MSGNYVSPMTSSSACSYTRTPSRKIECVGISKIITYIYMGYSKTQHMFELSHAITFFFDSHFNGDE